MFVPEAGSQDHSDPGQVGQVGQVGQDRSSPGPVRVTQDAPSGQ